MAVASEQYWPVLGIVGWSGSGKTTLIEALLPTLREQQLAVSVIKHSHHDIVLDQPGKDTFRHRQAGAQQVMLVSPYRWGVFTEQPRDSGFDLNAQLAQLMPCDLVLVEGQKQLPLPKLEVFRPSAGHAPRYLTDPDIIAVASDQPVQAPCVVLDLNNINQVAGFICQWLVTQR